MYERFRTKEERDHARLSLETHALSGVLTLTGQSFTFYAYLRLPRPILADRWYNRGELHSSSSSSSYAVGALAVSRKQQAVYGCSLRSSRIAFPPFSLGSLLLTVEDEVVAAVASRALRLLGIGPRTPGTDTLSPFYKRVGYGERERARK